MEEGQGVAVFDLDGTLSRGDLFLGFLGHVLRRRGPARPLRTAALVVRTAQFMVGLIGNDRLKAAYIDAILGGWPRSMMQAEAADFAARASAREIKPAALAAVRAHREAGHLLVLASASLDLYVIPIGKLLGFDAVLATRVAWTADNRVAGTLDGPNLRGIAKRDAVQTLLAERGIPPAQLVAYSDHISDAPLLDAADEAVVVDPKRPMRDLALTRGWKIADWSRANDVALPMQQNDPSPRPTA